MLGMDGYHIISSKRELVQVAGYSKLISRPSTAVIYGWMNLYSKNYENSNPRKPIQGIKLSELQKKVLFQVENHSVGHLMPKTSHPWEKNGMT